MRDSQSMLAMMMDTDLTDELKEHVRDAIGRRVRITLMGMASFELKPDKFENRILAFTACRLFVLHPKAPCKIDWTFNYLDIEAIESKTPDQLMLTVSGKIHRVRCVAVKGRDVNPFLDRVVEAVCGALKSIFPSVPLERVIRRVELLPAERQAALQTALLAVGEGGTGGAEQQGPCGGYSKMYACMCDYHNQPYRDEVAWDVDTIYHAHNNREFCLQDFDHLDASDMVPIIAALEFNTWFVGIRATHVQLSEKALEQLVKVVGRSLHLQVLQLDSMSTKPTFVRDISMAMVANSGTNIQSIDLSGNPIDEKGANALSGPIARAPHGLIRLNLSKTMLGPKLLNNLSHSLSLNRYMTKTLKSLVLADNNTSGKSGGHGSASEDLSNLYNFLAQPNAISHLDLQNTDVNLEMLFGTLHRGCTQHLTSLNVSLCAFTSSKKSRYTYVPQPSFKQFFASALALKQIDMSYVKGFTCDVLKALFLSVASNPNLNELELTLRGNELKSPMALQIMETCLPDIPCIAGIDLTDNGLDHEFATVLAALARNQALKRLRLGRNFTQVKSKRLSVIMHALVHLLHHDASRLEALDVSECKFRHGTSLILSALGTNQHLKTIDIGGNYCGNAGARVLAKALQVNTRLETIQLDRNLIDSSGFEDLAWGLQHNYSLRNLSYPASDVMEAVKQTPLNADALQATMKRIETLLWRNQNPDGYNWAERLQRLHQSAYASTSSQVVDQLLVQIQDLFEAVKRFPKYRASTALEEHVKRCVQQADGYKQLLTRLQEVGFMSSGGGGGNSGTAKNQSDSLDSTLRDSIGGLCDTMDGELRHRVESMCQQTGVLFPDMFDKKKAFRSDLLDGARLADDFVARMRQRMDEELRQRMREVLLETAARLSQRVFEEVVESLNHCHELLVDIQKQESGSPSGTAPRPHSALSSATATTTAGAGAAGSTTQIRQQFLRQGTQESVSATDGARGNVVAQQRLLLQQHQQQQQQQNSMQSRQMHANYHSSGPAGQQIMISSHHHHHHHHPHHHDKDSVIYGRLIRPPSQSITADLTGGSLNAGGAPSAPDGPLFGPGIIITGPFMKLSELREHAAPSPSEIPQDEPRERQKKLDHLCRDRPRPNRRRQPNVRPSRALSSSNTANPPASAGIVAGSGSGTTGRGRRSSSSSITMTTNTTPNNTTNNSTTSRFFGNAASSTTTTNMEEPYYGVTSANQYNMLDIGEGLDEFFGTPSAAAVAAGNKMSSSGLNVMMSNSTAARRTSRQNSDSSQLMLEEVVEVSKEQNGGAKTAPSSSSKEKSKRKGLFKLFTSSASSSSSSSAAAAAAAAAAANNDASGGLRKKSSSRSRVASSPRSPSSSSSSRANESDRVLLRQVHQVTPPLPQPQAQPPSQPTNPNISRAALLSDSIQQFHAEKQRKTTTTTPRDSSQTSAPPTPLTTPKKHLAAATPTAASSGVGGSPSVFGNNPFASVMTAAAAAAAAASSSSSHSPAAVRRNFLLSPAAVAAAAVAVSAVDISDGAAAKTSRVAGAAAATGFGSSDAVNRNLLAEMRAKHDSKQQATRVMAALPERPENVVISSESSSGNSSAASTPAVSTAVNTTKSLARTAAAAVDPGVVKPAADADADDDSDDTNDDDDAASSSESENAQLPAAAAAGVSTSAAPPKRIQAGSTNVVSQTRELLNAAFLSQQQQQNGTFSTHGAAAPPHRIAPPPGGKLLWHPMNNNSSSTTANGETFTHAAATNSSNAAAAAEPPPPDVPPPLPPRNPTFGADISGSSNNNHNAIGSSSVTSTPPVVPGSMGSVAAAAAAVAAATAAARPAAAVFKNSVPVFATGAVSSQLSRSKSFYTAREAAAAAAAAAEAAAAIPSAAEKQHTTADDGSGDRAAINLISSDNTGNASANNTPLLTGRGRQHNRIKERVRSLFAEADANL